MTGIEGSILLALKIFVLIGLGVYTVFAAVMLQQARLMSNVLEKAYIFGLSLVAIIHLFAAIGLFFLALFIL